MICPQCQRLGLKSRVTTGPSTTTAMYIPTVYDEQGRLMPPLARNRTSTECTCSNGHRWTQRT